MLEEKSYPKITKKFVKSQVYELDINDFLSKLTPPPGFSVKPIDPTDYYITSGDAIQKTKYLAKILWDYAGRVRHELHEMENPTLEQSEFESECWRQAGAATKLLNLLIKVRGEDVFLETEWDAHRLICIPKNPRSKQEDSE